MKTLLALFMLMTTSAYAAPYNQSVTLPNEKLLLKPTKEFNAIILLVKDSDKFKQAWMDHNPNVTIATIDKIKQTDSLHAYIVLSNCTIKNKVCNVTFKGKILQPNKEIMDIPVSDLITRDFPKTSLGVGDNVVDVQFDKNDPLGVYKINFEVTDNNSKKTIPLYKEFSLVK